MMCVSNRTLYTNHIPDTFVMILGFISLLFFVFFLKNTKSHQYFIILSVGIMNLLITINYFNSSVYRAIIIFGNFTLLSSIVLLSSVDKKALLDFLSKILFCILSISLIGWLFHMAGFTMPVLENVDLNNDVHNLNNHYIYYDNAYALANVFPRFRGIFIEPGQLATPCVFLFFARGAVIKDKTNMLLLLVTFFSFSLAGYVTLIVGLFLFYLFAERKYKIARIMGLVLIIGTTTFYIVKNANQDNPLLNLIIERLEYDEEIGLTGNNRSDTTFDNYYDQYVKSDKILFGMGDEIRVGNTSWTNHASGIRKFFVYYGVFGVMNMILLTLLLLKVNYCRSSIVFFIVIWLAFLVRDMLQTPFWLTLAILGFDNLRRIDSVKNNRIIFDGAK